MDTHARPDSLDAWPADTLQRLMAQWIEHRATRHTYLEVAAGPLPEGEPVPGCTCLACAVLRIGGLDEDVEGAERVVGILADRTPDEREDVARAIVADCRWTLPPARTLVRYASAVRRSPVVGIALDLPAPRQRWPTVRQPLPVEQAREVPILKVVEHLGLGSPRKVGREYAIHCFLHQDRHPRPDPKTTCRQPRPIRSGACRQRPGHHERAT